MAPKRSDERPLTVLVIDVSPVEWGERDLLRTVSDKKRLAQGKVSLGPATLEELLAAVQAFSGAFLTTERESALVMIAVAGNETAVVYPRKDQLEEYFSNQAATKLDTRKIQNDLIEGVTELVSRAANKATMTTTSSSNNEESMTTLESTQAAMASGFSMALCMVNRFLVSVRAGVSALHDDHVWNRGNADDEGVITAIGAGGKKKSNRKARPWSPRVLLIQASEDRPSDYNAIMNCAFAAVKHQIVVDGCFIPGNGSLSSAYMEQACDLTGGIFLAPKGRSQANKTLTEVLLGVFLPPRSCRSRLNLPANNKVDFRARAFDTGEIVDTAFVCNQCLSIFQKKPHGHCPTCEAEIRTKKQRL